MVSAADTDSKPLSLIGYQGKIDGLEIVNKKAVDAKSLAAAPSKHDISLTDMASSSMNYLIHNPLPDHNYECRFCIQPVGYPLSMYDGTADPYIAFGDTESRMLREFNFMREMSGSKAGAEVEEGIRKRVWGYVREDGLSWLPPYCLECSTPEHTPAALTWSGGTLVSNLVEIYWRTGDRKNLAMAKKMVGGLKSLASWDTGRAYYPGGLGGWRDGKWMFTGCADCYPCIVEPIAQYADASGDQDALSFACAFADGMMSDLQTNLGDNKIRADGSFGGYNCHLHMRAVLGVTHLGVVTKTTRYTEWGRRVYDFMLSQGTDWGWFPEQPHGYVSETCAVGDMAETASWLAKAGYTKCWDDLERFVRNYVHEAQFFVTPQYESYYKQLHTPEQAADGLRQALDFEGGFVARLSPNKLTYEDYNTMNMMGCCPPEAMRALHISWHNVVTRSPKGVYVNMSFDRDAPEAQVQSFAPEAGRLSVVVKKPADFFIRPPSWATRSQVKAWRGNKQATAEWNGDYIKFAKAAKGESLTITYPVPTFKQTVEIAGKTYTYRWIGNTVTGVEPASAVMPIFAGTTTK